MNKRKFLRLACLAGVVVGGLLVVVCAVLPLVFTQASPSMGIIGGADGPTVIVVANSTGLNWDVLIGIILLIAGTAGLILTRRKR